jgi:hypothetical protein
MNNGYLSLRSLLDETELRQRSDAVVETNFRDDHAVLDLENSRAREPHLAARVGRERSHQEVAEGGTGVRAAAHPLADDVIAFGDQVRGATEGEIGKRAPEIGHEGLDVGTAAAWLMQRELQEHIGRGEFIDDGEIALLTPEAGEPAADNGFVIALF